MGPNDNLTSDVITAIVYIIAIVGVSMLTKEAVLIIFDLIS